MRDYKTETQNRINWIRSIISNANAKGVIYGNSGGKDSALVGILCKKATDNTLGVILPCNSKQNYESDKEHAYLVANKFNIKTEIVDLTEARNSLLNNIKFDITLSKHAVSNINPRLRMTALYAIGQSLGYIVAGTGNKSEAYMGYFTKYGDGGVDFNPIADLTVTEIFEFLRYLDAPTEIIEKAPSAGLYEGQTDENEMGISYNVIDKYLKTGQISDSDFKIIDKAHKSTEHKRNLPLIYNADIK